MVTVYSKNNCMQCKMVKKYLSERGVDFIEHNIESEPEFRDYLVEKGYQAVPVVETLETSFYGFRPSELAAIVG